MAANHKRELTPAVRLDIQWWDTVMCTFNGSSLILDNVPVTAVFTDACDTAAGGYYDGNWLCLTGQ